MATVLQSMHDIVLCFLHHAAIIYTQILPRAHLSIREEDKSVEHVEDLKSRLVDGEDHRPVGVSQLVKVS